MTKPADLSSLALPDSPEGRISGNARMLILNYGLASATRGGEYIEPTCRALMDYVADLEASSLTPKEADAITYRLDTDHWHTDEQRDSIRPKLRFIGSVRRLSGSSRGEEK